MNDPLFWLKPGSGLVGTTEFVLEENKMLREIITLQDEQIAALRAQVEKLSKNAGHPSQPAQIEWRN